MTVLTTTSLHSRCLLSSSGTVTVDDKQSCLFVFDWSKLAATLWWFTAAPKPLKIQVFWGVSQPPGVVQPLYSRGHN